jgi:hypothetical protein
MREIKVIPLVLSIIGLMTCGYAISYSTNDLTQSFNLESFLMLGFGIVMFIVLLLLSVGIIGDKNKFTW